MRCSVLTPILNTAPNRTLHCIRAVLPHFKKKREGRIVNISSMAGIMGVFGYSAYCASKHAVAGLTASLRIELIHQNILVHIVLPPEFNSPMALAVDPKNVLVFVPEFVTFLPSMMR